MYVLDIWTGKQDTRKNTGLEYFYFFCWKCSYLTCVWETYSQYFTSTFIDLKNVTIFLFLKG